MIKFRRISDREQVFARKKQEEELEARIDARLEEFPKILPTPKNITGLYRLFKNRIGFSPAISTTLTATYYTGTTVAVGLSTIATGIIGYNLLQ